MLVSPIVSVGRHVASERRRLRRIRAAGLARRLSDSRAVIPKTVGDVLGQNVALMHNATTGNMNNMTCIVLFGRSCLVVLLAPARRVVRYDSCASRTI
jgi:hypothetical protein